MNSQTRKVFCPVAFFEGQMPRIDWLCGSLTGKCFNKFASMIALPNTECNTITDRITKQAIKLTVFK